MYRLRCIYVAASLLITLASPFAPPTATPLSSSHSPLKTQRMMSGSLFDDPAGWFKRTMDVMQDRREVTLYHILMRDSKSGNSLEAGLGTLTVVEDATAKLEEIKESVMSNEDEASRLEAFSASAKEFGTDSSAAKGGYLGKFKRGQLLSTVDDAVFSGEVCQVIGPVTSIYGTHLFWVSERTQR